MTSAATTSDVLAAITAAYGYANVELANTSAQGKQHDATLPTLRGGIFGRCSCDIPEHWRTREQAAG